MGIAGFDTVLPLFLATLTSSTLLIGLVTAIGTAVGFFPQLWTAKLVEERGRSQPTVLRLSAAARLAWFLIVLLTLHVTRWPRSLTAGAFLVVLTIFKLLDGGGLPAWLDLQARCIPLEWRGRLWGWRNGAAGLGGLAGAVMVGRLLGRYPYPRNYAVVFSCALAGMLLSHLCMSLVREPGPRTVDRKGRGFGTYFRSLGRMLSSDPNYVRYLVVLALIGQSTLATAFYSVYAVSRWMLPISVAGTFSGLILGAQLATNGLLGALGDRRGFKAVMQVSLAFQALAAGLMSLAASMPIVCLVFAVYGIAASANKIASMNMVLEFGAPETRPTYVGLTNTVVAPFAIAAPLLGGVLIERAGYKATFGLAAAVMLAALLALHFWVEEPRRTTQRIIGSET
jgi:MFS family permease